MKKFFLIPLCAIILSACSTNYKVDVDLSSEEITELQQEINRYFEEIEALKAFDGSYIDQKFIVIARDYQALGDLGGAIDTYKKAIDEGYQTGVILNNLGRLYEDVGEYQSAVESYQQIILDYGNKDYLHDIALVYMKINDVDNAGQYYKAWKDFSKSTDTEIESYLNNHSSES